MELLADSVSHQFLKNKSIAEKTPTSYYKRNTIERDICSWTEQFAYEPKITMGWIKNHFDSNG